MQAVPELFDDGLALQVPDLDARLQEVADTLRQASVRQGMMAEGAGDHTDTATRHSTYVKFRGIAARRPIRTADL